MRSKLDTLDFILFGVFIGMVIGSIIMSIMYFNDYENQRVNFCLPKNVTGTFIQTEQPTITVIYTKEQYNKLINDKKSMPELR